MAGKPLDQLKLDYLIKNAITENLLKTLAERAVEMVKTRTRLGYGVAGEKFAGSQQKLESLKSSTVENRKRKTLHPDTSPKKSNLTDTGQLLDSISYEVSGNRITVFLKGQRNQTVAEYVSDARPFFALSKPEVTRLADLIQKAITTHLSKGK